MPDFNLKTPEREAATVTVEPDKAEGARFDGTFVLGAVVINGSTVFSSETLAQDFEPLLASSIGQEQLNDIVERITRRYRDTGYLLSYAMLPPQDVKSGIVRIDVVEGFVSGVQFEGAGRETPALKAITSRLSADRPLRDSTLERVIGLLRDVPGTAVTDVRISRSQREPGRHELTIVIARDTHRALIYGDSRGTTKGARARVYSAMSSASLLLPGDQWQINLFAIPGDRFHFLYGQALASAPIGNDGVRLGGAVSFGDQRLGSGEDRRDGISRNLMAQVSYPFLKSRTLSITGKVALNDWRTTDRNRGPIVQRDRLRAARVYLDIKSVGTSQLDVQLSMSQGLGFDAATRRGDPLSSRIDASGRFTKFNFEVQSSHALSEKLRMRGNVIGQYSTKPLLSIEEFALGGNRVGRAYDFNSITGDHGLGGALEIGYQIGDLTRSIRQVEPFIYGDGGVGIQSGHPVDVDRTQWLASFGAGARFVLYGFAVSAELGIPLAKVKDSGSVRAFVSIAKSF